MLHVLDAIPMPCRMLLGLLLFISTGFSDEKRCMFGIYEPAPKDALARVKTFEAATDAQTTIVAWHADFMDRFPLESCAQAWAAHRLPLIKWDLKTGGGSPRTISLHSILSGEFDSYLQSWADEAAQFGQPVLIEILRQFNRSQVAWSSANQQQDATHVAEAFRKIIEVFRDRGAGNVRWVWCPHIFPSPPTGWNNWEDAFPGNSFVDFVALEGYDLNRIAASDLPLSLEQLYGFPVRKAKQLAPKKPVLLTDIPMPRNDADREKMGQGLSQLLMSSGSSVKGVVFTSLGDHPLQDADMRFLQKILRDPREPLSIQELVRRPFWPFQWFGYAKTISPLLPTWKATFLPEIPVTSVPTALKGSLALHLAFPGVTLVGQDLARLENFSGQIRFGWNPSNLLFWCEVDDASVGECYFEPGKIWDGDNLEIAIGATGLPDTVELRNCIRLQISPGNASHMQPAIAWIQASSGVIRTKIDGLEVHSQFGVDGKSYRIYGSIPWRALDFSPAGSGRIRLNVTITDSSDGHRARQLIWSGGAHAYHDPSEWGYLQLSSETSDLE